MPTKKPKRVCIVESVAEAEGSCGCRPSESDLVLPEPKTPTDILLTLIFRAMPKAPEGRVFCIPPQTFTGVPVVVYDILEEPDAGNAPWFSCNLINDGTNSVYVRFNSEKGEFHEVKKNEDLTIDLHGPKLTHLYFKCAASETATVRIIGVR